MVSSTLLNKAVLAALPAATIALNLNVTTIGARDGHSTLECWQLDNPFSQSTTPGIAGTANAFLSDAANVSFTVIPSNFDGGLHNAPHNQ